MIKRPKNLVLPFTCLFLWACKPLVNFVAFHPNSDYILDAESLPPNTSQVFLTTDDKVRVQALYLKNPSAKFVTIFFHGNAGNIYHRINDLQTLRQLGTSVLALSYRGYAKSEGSPTEPGIYLDGKAAFDYLTQKLHIPPHQVFIFGRSIGANVAINLAQNKSIAGLILVSPMTNGHEMAAKMGLGFTIPLTNNIFQNDKKIKQVKTSLLIIHGDQDAVIPISMGQTLFEAANPPKVFQKISGAGHNDLSQRFSGKYWTAIAKFFGKVVKSK